MATIKDIAKEAGVSTMTVSRVINKRYNQVSAENIARIQEIMRKHNYVPNSAARSLSSKASRIIAIFVQGNAAELYRPYNASMMGYLIQEIQNQGYDAMAYFINDYSEVANKLKSWNAAGAIFFGMVEKDFLQLPSAAKIPFIFTDCYSKSRQFFNVGIDDYKGGVLAARHFIENGHRNMAVVGEFIQDSPVSQSRVKGFVDTLNNAGITMQSDRIVTVHSLESTIGHLVNWKENHLGIFVLEDILAMRLIKALNNAGYNIPEDFSIIGFDNLYTCELTNPGLTTISQDLSKKAKEAVNLLFQILKYSELPIQKITLDVELVRRGTVKNLK